MSQSTRSTHPTRMTGVIAAAVMALVIFSLDYLAGLCWHLISGEAARIQNARLRDSTDGVPIDGVTLYQIDHLIAE